MTTIFKYFSDGVMEHVFFRDGHVGIKCSLPKDYNDPFELFLGVDLSQGPDLLATYRDVVHEIPSLLTTCFSKSPVVSPMWAHYGNNHQGFVVGFDAALIEQAFPEVLIRDIAYLDRPSDDLARFTEMASRRKKPRDAMALRNAVLYHGYFSKYLEWGYEQEVRAANVQDYVEEIEGHNILYVPTQCVVAIISGARSSVPDRQHIEKVARSADLNLYIEKIGISYPTPYLIDGNGVPSVFADGKIAPPLGVCRECSEPLRNNGDLCPWCSIDEVDQSAAAANNPFRILDKFGLLEKYMEDFPNHPRKPYK